MLVRFKTFQNICFGCSDYVMSLTAKLLMKFHKAMLTAGNDYCMICAKFSNGFLLDYARLQKMQKNSLKLINQLAIGCVKVGVDGIEVFSL